MPTPLDFSPGSRVRRTFTTDLCPTPKVGVIVDEICVVMNSKLRGCVMVVWDGTVEATAVHPSNLEML